ncbi:MAG: iron-sulfur cluster assembly accessory protein [Planctomycetaceae bacterium]|jgi:iron-sulfur cluster assembly protein|nr:iron-sulfur cluster assembly accessory protein [Planctomycetaceae bacterium]
MITITSTAVGEVKKVKESRNLGDETFLRIAVLGGGCSGMQYALNFDTAFDAVNDTTYNYDGVKLATLKKYDPHFDGTEIDFVSNAVSSGFTIENPNFPRTGGCPGCCH